MNDWIELSTEEDFNNLLERSVKKPQIIFKDSVTCGISAYAKERLIQQYDLLQGKADFNYLDLLAYRPTSKLVAEALQVTHQSPQIIIVKDKKAVYTTSHHSIKPEVIATKL